MSRDRICVVHNGIIENFEQIRRELQAQGYRFDSDTDSEVIAHLIESLQTDGRSLVDAVRLATQQLEGAYAIGVISRDEPDRLVGARIGSPLVVGIGIGENFLASDVLALRPVTDRFVFLEEGDLVEITANDMLVWSVANETVVRSTVRVQARQRRRRQGQLSPPHAERDPRATEGRFATRSKDALRRRACLSLRLA